MSVAAFFFLRNFTINGLAHHSDGGLGLGTVKKILLSLF